MESIIINQYKAIFKGLIIRIRVVYTYTYEMCSRLFLLENCESKEVEVKNCLMKGI